MSHDFEDVIYIIDNNRDLFNDVTQADKEVKNFLKEMSHDILTHPHRNEIIESHLNPVTAEKRRDIIIEKLKQIEILV